MINLTLWACCSTHYKQFSRISHRTPLYAQRYTHNSSTAIIWATIHYFRIQGDPEDVEPKNHKIQYICYH